MMIRHKMDLNSYRRQRAGHRAFLLRMMKLQQGSIYRRQRVVRRAFLRRKMSLLQLGRMDQSRVVAYLLHKKNLRLGKTYRMELVGHRAFLHRKKTILSHRRGQVAHTAVVHRKKVRRKKMNLQRRDLPCRILHRKQKILLCSSLLDTVRGGIHRCRLDTCLHRMIHRRRNFLDCTMDWTRRILHCWIHRDLLDGNLAYLRCRIRRDLVRGSWAGMLGSFYRSNLGSCWNCMPFCSRRLPT
mmetsp:Transcript_5391/g.6772  ORF Transcript_5391/g.6772 Transcript_5391/m.6772 type:complete len:241 (-) Transcript_5391:284-1006(-)